MNRYNFDKFNIRVSIVKFFINKLLFIIILSSISKISLSHEFWIDPVKYHLKNDNEINAKASVFIGDNFEGSQIGFSKKVLLKN